MQFHCFDKNAEPHLLKRTGKIITASAFHTACLSAVAQLQLPESFIGAGFLRNLIWDHLHYYWPPTPLNDVDVVYYCAADTSKQTEQQLEQSLSQIMPDVKWQVRNQARMHVHKDHAPYGSTTEAIRHWVETATCVGIRQEAKHDYCITAPLGLADNWSGRIRQNPAFDDTVVYNQRIKNKGWLQRWPSLKIV